MKMMQKKRKKMSGGGHKRSKIKAFRTLACLLAFALVMGSLSSAASFGARAAEEVPDSAGTEITTTIEEENVPPEELLPEEQVTPEEAEEAPEEQVSEEEPVTPEEMPAGVIVTPEEVTEEVTEEETVTEEALKSGTITIIIKPGQYASIYKDFDNAYDKENDAYTYSFSDALSFEQTVEAIVNEKITCGYNYGDAYVTFEKFSETNDPEAAGVTAFENGKTYYAHYKLKDNCYPIIYTVYDQDYNVYTFGSSLLGRHWYHTTPAFYNSSEGIASFSEPQMQFDAVEWGWDYWYTKDIQNKEDHTEANKISSIPADTTGEIRLYAMATEPAGRHDFHYTAYDTEGNDYSEKINQLVPKGVLDAYFYEDENAQPYIVRTPKRTELESVGITGMSFRGWYRSYSENDGFTDPYPFSVLYREYIVPENENADVVPAVAKLAKAWDISYMVYDEDGNDVTSNYYQLTDNNVFPQEYTAEDTITLPAIDDAEFINEIPAGYEFGGWYEDYNSSTKTFSNPVTNPVITPETTGTAGEDKTYYGRILKTLAPADVLTAIGPDDVCGDTVVLFTNEGYGTLSDVEEKLLKHKGFVFADSVDKNTKTSALATGYACQLEVTKADGNGTVAPVPFRFATITGINLYFLDLLTGENVASRITLKAGKLSVMTAVPLMTGGTWTDPVMFEKYEKLMAKAHQAVKIQLTPADSLSGITCELENGDPTSPDYDPLIWWVKAPDTVAKKTTGKLTLTVTLAAGKVKGTADVTLLPAGYEFRLDGLDNSIAGIEEVLTADYYLLSTSLKPGKGKSTTVFLTGRLNEPYPVAAKLSVKSDNTKAVKTGKISWGESETSITNTKRTKEGEVYFSIPLTVTGTGFAQISVTANDVAKTTEDILIEVRDDAAKITNTKLTLNKKITAGQMLNVKDAFVMPDAHSFELKVKSVSAKNKNVTADASWFTVVNTQLFEDEASPSKPTGHTHELQVTVEGASAMPDGVYYVTLEDNTVSKTQTTLTVTVNGKQPKVSVKQLSKIYLTANTGDQFTDLLLTAKDAEITGAKIVESGADAPFVGDSYYYYDGTHTLRVVRNKDYTGKADLSKKENRRVTVALDIAGYRDGAVTVQVTLDAAEKFPAVRAEKNSVTLYPEIVHNSDEQIRLLDGKTKLPNELRDDITADETLSKYVKLRQVSGDGAYRVEAIPGLSAYPEKVSGKVTFKLNAYGDQEFTVPLTVNFKTKGYRFGLSKNAFVLNANNSLESARADLLTDRKRMTLDSDKVSVKIVPGKNASGVTEEMLEQISAELQLTYGMRVKWATDKPSLPAGNYKFIAQLTVKATGQTYDLPFTVKVVNTALEKCLSFKQSGKIDLTDPDSYVLLTWKQSKLNSYIYDVILDGADAGKFETNTGPDYETGLYKTEISLKADVDRHALRKGTAFDLKVRAVTLPDKYGTKTVLLDKKLTIKPVQGKPKLTLTPKSGAAVLSPAKIRVGESLAMTVAAEYNNNPVEIESIRTVEAPDKFSVMTEPQMDGSVKVEITPMKRLPRGTHTVKLYVTYKNQAGNVKDTVINYKIRVQ